MRELYSKFGEIIFVDGTYKINKNDYAGYLISVVDDHGVI